MNAGSLDILSSSLAPGSPRILVRGVNWLGDAVMTTPALQRLREAYPKAHIALLSPEKLAGLWQGYPDINSLITFSREESIWKIAKRLRDEKFEVGLIFPNSPRSALELFLAGIPQRVGYAGSLRSFLLTEKISPREGEVKMRKRSVAEIKKLVALSETNSQLSTLNFQLPKEAHQLNQYLHLVAALGANPEPLTPHLEVAEEEVRAFKRRFDVPENKRLFGLNPGAEYGPAKRWPQERFIQAAVEIQKKTDCSWLVFGGKADLELAATIAGKIKEASGHANTVFNLAGKTTLRELRAALKGCDILLTNDTGPMHVAAAVGTPVVVPFGSTSPEMTGPGLPGQMRHQLIKSNAPCSPCFLRDCPIDFRCMNGIQTNRVIQAVLELAKR